MSGAAPEIKAQLDNILGHVKEQKAQVEAIKTSQGTFSAEFAAAVEQLNTLQKQADAIDIKLADKSANGNGDDTVENFLREYAPLQDWLKSHRGVITIPLKGKHSYSNAKQRSTPARSAA